MGHPAVTAPVTGITPIYGLEYIVQGEPARYARQKLERSMKQVEAALQLGGVAAPGASDLLAVSGRVSTLEQAAAARPFAVLLGASGTTAVPNGAWTVLPLTGTEEADPLGGHSTVTNPSRWTCPAGWGGWYDVLDTTRIDSGTGKRSCGIRKNGAEVQRSNNTVGVGSAGAYVFGSTPALILLAPGDYVEVAVLQDSGGALTANNTFSSMTLSRKYAA